jgi:hypothetical protein
VVEPGVILQANRQVVLSEPQRRALEWLLSEEGATVKDAAEFAGVARSTVSRWLNSDPDFKAIYETWLAHQRQMNDAQLSGMEATALDVLHEAVRQRRDVRAAEFIIKQVTARRQRAERERQREQRDVDCHNGTSGT